jgi:excisionase family DNA binding protein
MQAPSPDLRTLSVAEAASQTGLTVRAIRHLIATRRLPAARLGRAIRIRPADLASLLHTTQADA